MKRISVLITVLIVTSVLLTACGGGGGGAAAGAKSFFDAFAKLDIAKMKELTCDAQKQSMETSLGAMAAVGSGIKIDVSGLSFAEKSVSGNTAVVVVSGKMKIELLGQSQEQPVNNQELPMANEGGTWKVCGANALGQ
jgi:hypothetical protein